MALILNRLRSGHSITPEALVEYVSDRARLLDERMGSVSLRTIQRDIKTIGELFHFGASPACIQYKHFRPVVCHKRVSSGGV